MSNSWPSGVPETLWNYSVLQEKVAPQIPMMGIEIAPRFLYMFAVGCGFIAYFAWDRFKKRRTETDAFSLRVMKEVGVAELGGTGALRRAYLLYMITLMSVYVAMTFFGKLIFQTLNSLNVAGIQVDSNSLKFDSPQWPLLLAFGLAGLAPLVMPLRVAEDWLFGRAYRAVGIPVRIHQTTRNLIDILDNYADALAKRPPETTPETATAAEGHASADEKAASALSTSASAPDATTAKAPAPPSSLRDELARKRAYLDRRLKGTWAKAMLDTWGKEDDAFAVFSELLLFVDWAKGGRGSWPGPEVSDEVRKLEQKLVEESETLINGFFDQLEPADKKVSDKAVISRKQRLADFLRDALALRTEFLAVLAVYAERDPTYVGKSEPSGEPENGTTSLRITIRPALRELLGQAEPPNLAGSGPEAGLLLCLVPVFLLYAIFTWQGLHPAISSGADPSDWRTVVATAGVETLRVMAIVWLPLVAAFAVRQMFHDRGIWALSATREDGSAWTEQRVIVLSVASAVSVVGLIGLALLWSFLIAQSVSRFQSLLFSGSPYILFLPTQAIVTLPIVFSAIWGADARTRGYSASWIGVACGVLVIGALGSHMAFWYGEHRTCTALGTFLLDLFSPGCFKYYGGLDLFVYPILGFLAAAVFGNPSRVTPGERRAQRRTAPAVLQTSVLLLAAVALASPSAHAQERIPVTVGFRADAEPFSYRIDPDRMLPKDVPHLGQYAGYIADLCYYIFDQSPYEIKEVEVTAENRFDLLKADSSQPEHIDVLCDPVTLRFSEPDRAGAGIFSPIVFASSVTYLENRSRDRRNSVYVAYVANTTANLVVKHACQIDLFTAIPYDERDHLETMCRTAEAARLIEDIRIHLHATDGRIDREQPKVDPANLRVAIATLDDAMGFEQQFAEDKNNKATSDKKETTGALLALWGTRKAESAQLRETCTKGACDWTAVGDDLLAMESRLGSTCRDLELDPPEPAVGSPELLPDQKDQLAKQQMLLAQNTYYRYCPQPGHAAAIEWLCAPRFGSAARKSLIYLGDRDVILGKLRSWNNDRSKCVVANANGAEDLTYEPYAIMVSEKAENAIALVKHVQRRVYEFFSFRARAVGVFDTYFPQTTGISPLLAYLFLLNATEEERNFLNPTPAPKPDEPVPMSAPNAAVISQAMPAETGVARVPRPRDAGASPGSDRQP